MSPLGYMWSPDPSPAGKQSVQRNIFGAVEVVPQHRAYSRSMRGTDTSPRVVSMMEQPCVKTPGNYTGDSICSRGPCRTQQPEVVGASRPPLGDITNTADSDTSLSSGNAPAAPHGTNKNSQSLPRIKHTTARKQSQIRQLTTLQEVNIKDNGDSSAPRSSGGNGCAEELYQAPVTPTNAEDWCLHLRTVNIQVTQFTVCKEFRIWHCTRVRVLFN